MTRFGMPVPTGQQLSLQLALLTLTVLLLQVCQTPVQACSCVFPHPQDLYCSSTWVIKANVKISRVRWETNTTRVKYYGVKISRIYKPAPGLVRGKYARLYTPLSSAACGAFLRTNATYVIQGRMEGSKPTFTLCDGAEMWSRLTDTQMRGYRYLYRRHCGCQIRYYCDDFANCDGCLFGGPRWTFTQRACYSDNAVCVRTRQPDDVAQATLPLGVPDFTSSCRWSLRGGRCPLEIPEEQLP